MKLSYCCNNTLILWHPTVWKNSDIRPSLVSCTSGKTIKCPSYYHCFALFFSALYSLFLPWTISSPDMVHPDTHFRCYMTWYPIHLGLLLGRPNSRYSYTMQQHWIMLRRATLKSWPICYKLCLYVKSILPWNTKWHVISWYPVISGACLLLISSAVCSLCSSSATLTLRISFLIARS